MRHVVGGPAGGASEWTAAPAARSLPGITALELADNGAITKITSLYDSRQLEPDHRAALARGSLAPSATIFQHHPTRNGVYARDADLPPDEHPGRSTRPRDDHRTQP